MQGAVITAPLRLLRNLVVNLALLARNLATLLRRPPDYVRIDLGGPVPERSPPVRPFRRRATSLADLRDLFQRIARDRAVRGVVLRLRSIDVGWARLDALRGLIVDLRAAGKEVVAHLVAPATRDYYVACAANRVVLEPPGTLGLVGLKAEVAFLGGLLERVGVRADLHAVGSYKSAAEPLTRRAMSAEHRAQVEAILDATYERLVAAIVEGRGLGPDEVRRRIDAGPYVPEEARAAGLCDDVLYADELAERLAPKGGRRARILGVRAYRRARARWSWIPLRPRRAVGVIALRGTIVDGEGVRASTLLCGADAVARALRAARVSPRVAAVVLYVQSPGGSGLASDRLWRAALRLARRKPLVACFGDVAASGGYYAACAAHEIVAQPGTITGSIGVVGGKLVLDGLYARLGIAKEIVARGARASMLTEARPFTEDERAHLFADLRAFYDEFLWRVSAGRAMTVELCDLRGEGRIYTGVQAVDVGLVDRLGGVREAIDRAAERARRCPGERFDTRDLLVRPRRPPLVGRLLAHAGPLALLPLRLRITGLALLLLGCAARPRPEDAVRAYADAVERADAAAAWAMLSREARARTTREEFAEQVRADPEENRRAAEAWRRAADAARTRVQARFEYGDEHALRLVRQGDAWRIDVDPLDFYPQATPRQALRSFVVALERRRYDVLLGLAPDRWRREMTEEDLRRDFDGPRRAEIEALVAELRAHLGDVIEEQGDHARVTWAGEREVAFVREDGRWRVEDVE